MAAAEAMAAESSSATAEAATPQPDLQEAPPITLSPEEQLAQRRKNAGLEGVELKFVPASGKFRNKKDWFAEMPPTVLTEDRDFRYFCAAIVENESKELRTRPGVNITFRAFDQDGRLQMDVSNGVPYKGGFYFYQDIHLECMPWTLQLFARLPGDEPGNPPLFSHTHIITTQSGRRPAPPRPVKEGHEMETDSEDEDETAPASRRKGHPMRSCGPKDMAAGQGLVKITGKKDLPRLIKKRKSLRKNRRWHLFEGIISGTTRTIFSRASFQRELLAFMNKNSKVSGRPERRRALYRSHDAQ